MSLTGYIIHSHFKDDLVQEVGTSDLSTDQIIFSKNGVQKSIWSQDTLHDVEIASFQSIKDAAKILLGKGFRWYNFSQSHHRRSELIQENLKSVTIPKISFLQNIEKKPFGIWGLLDQNKLFYSTQTESPIATGEFHFNEDKETPPSRAYLKLWEAMTVYGAQPKSTQTVVDMGSCPGGWSWVLAQVSGKVWSVDKAPLDPKVSANKKIHFLKRDAFTLKPEDIGSIDWFFSDIICEPQRLYDLIQKWQPVVNNFVCTVKFKGKTDFQAIKFFQELQPTLLKHLYNNKHEITFIKIKE